MRGPHLDPEPLVSRDRRELLADADFTTRAEAHRAVTAVIEVWYNAERRHSTVGDVGPMPYERQLGRSARAA